MKRQKTVGMTKRMKMKKMNGNQSAFDSFSFLFEKQVMFQKKVQYIDGKVNGAKVDDIPCDSPSKFIYHMSAMQEELGEVLKADKRWKTHRNSTFVKDEKLDEIADVFITAMNIAMWSGFDHKQIYDAILNKIAVNHARIDKQRREHSEILSRD